MRNQVIHLAVGEIVLFLSCIHESRNVVKSQAESLRAVLPWSKGCFVDAQRTSSTESAKSKTATILARGVGIFLARRGPSVRCVCSQIVPRLTPPVESVASACRSRATSFGKNLAATKRCRRVSSGLYTTPMPPPSFSAMRWCEMVWPITGANLTSEKQASQ